MRIETKRLILRPFEALSAVIKPHEYTQRIWRVPVQDTEAMMHDPDLFALSEKIENSLGTDARFMLRPGDLSQIRILVEAPNAENCLLAMLRFTRAAEKKGYLTGPVEEED
ncbi:MAG: hypothetical protein J5589_10290 [Firmicutes bacterium]|nr:hypothetical protein [Bacillota bacterium]